MKIKNILIGLIVGTMVVGGGTTAFAASEGTGNPLDQLSSKIEYFTAGNLESIDSVPMQKIILSSQVSSVKLAEIEAAGLESIPATEIQLATAIPATELQMADSIPATEIQMATTLAGTVDDESLPAEAEGSVPVAATACVAATVGIAPSEDGEAPQPVE